MPSAFRNEQWNNPWQRQESNAAMLAVNPEVSELRLQLLQFTGLTPANRPCMAYTKQHMIKRSIDTVCSAIALVTLSPMFPIIACAIKMDGGPVFYVQQRVGKNGVMFPCYKFRSMEPDAEKKEIEYLKNAPEAHEEFKKNHKIKNNPFTTKFGRFMRRLHIDELPQLINVLKGEMSLVGPRPVMPKEIEEYGCDFIHYQSVLPGLSGPWQVRGCNKLSFHERVALESQYAQNWNLLTDLFIMLKTIPALLRREEAF